jgi:cap2 methyltransferase
MFIKFLLKTSNEGIGINYENIVVVNKDFEKIKHKLNNVKNLLNEIPEKKYNLIAKYLNLYDALRMTVKKVYHMQIVTNASLKIYEIMTQMNIIAILNTKELHMFCNAELPGGFIASINHYCKTIANIDIKWVASSYIHDTKALGDQYNIYKCNKDNWLMDTENNSMNGDLTRKDNIIELVKRVYNKFPHGVQLYTSDAGLDVTSDYNSQEEQTLLLNYGQVLCGLLTLQNNGIMITKQFTFFTLFNQSLLILLSQLFTNVYITKPSTSKTLNSEIYIICIGFNGIQDNIKQYLISRMDNVDPNIPLINNEISNNLLKIATTLYESQIEEIKYAYSTYNTYSEKINELKYKMEKPSKQSQSIWLENNPLKTINPKDYINYQC